MCNSCERRSAQVGEAGSATGRPGENELTSAEWLQRRYDEEDAYDVAGGLRLIVWVLFGCALVPVVALVAWWLS